jgi:hypothetical protein
MEVRLTEEMQTLVAWLRETEQIHKEHAKSGADRTRSQHHAEACRMIAEAIEREEYKRMIPRMPPTAAQDGQGSD